MEESISELASAPLGNVHFFMGISPANICLQFEGTG